nr:hypothetical protein CFP56_70603 [Quercus suber]
MIRSIQRCNEEAFHIGTQALSHDGQSGGSHRGGCRGGGRAGRGRTTEPDPIYEEGDDSGAKKSWLGTDWVLSNDGGRTSRWTSSASAGPSHSASHEGTILAQTTSYGASMDYKDPPPMLPPVFSGSTHDGGCIFVPTPGMPSPLVFAIGRHCFYVYYDGEQYFHDLHGLSYRGKSVKQKFIESKCGTHLRKMHWKIMEALGLDRGSHKISIVYHAPKILVITQVLYNSNSLGCDADMDMMWTVIKQTPKFIASDFGVEAPHSSPLDVQPSFANATPLPYNNQPCSAVDDFDETEVLGATYTHDVRGSSHIYEHVQAYIDGGIDIDASRDVYEEFIDIDGPVDDAEVLDVPLIENNEEDCPTIA